MELEDSAISAPRCQPQVRATVEESHTEHDSDCDDFDDYAGVPETSLIGHSSLQKRRAAMQLTKEYPRIPKRREVMVMEDEDEDEDEEEETPRHSNNKRVSRYRCLADVLTRNL